MELAIKDSDTPLVCGILGGEGSGKTVLGITKALDRIRRGMSGVAVCVAPDTLIDGIPIVERTQPGLVNTTSGVAWATASLCEGQADLFRVATLSGDWVSVTSSHRFLTPTGWRPLRDLHVGSLIAVDDTSHGRSWRETSPGSLDDYWSGLHPCGGYANPMELCIRDKWQRSGESLEHDYAPVCGVSQSTRVCTSCFPHQSQPGEVSAEYPSPYEVCEPYQWISGASHIGPQQSCQIDSPLGFYPDPTQHFAGIDAGMQSVHASLLPWLLGWQNNPVCHQLLAWLGLDRKASVFHRDRTFELPYVFPYPYYNMVYTEIASITFQSHGDYYGISVPGVGNYSAQGLFHHNSPDFEHFKRSMWPELRRWIPWDHVVANQQYRANVERLPEKPFQLVFDNEVGGKSVLIVGGGKESEAMAWEGPNINFAHIDEIRRHNSPILMKTLFGRIRIPGPNGEPPQMWITTSKRMHWLFDYFGPMKCTCSQCDHEYWWKMQVGTQPQCPRCNSPVFTTEDQWRDFKLQSAVLELFTRDNESAGNLSKGFTAQRALSLSSAEARLLLDAEWVDTEEGMPFIPNMQLWDRLADPNIPPLGKNDPIVIGVDAAKGRQDNYSDCFAIVGVSRHWDKLKRRNHVVVRFVYTWQARPGRSIDFMGTEQDPGPERVLRQLCQDYSIYQITYDPTQLHDLMTRLYNENVAWTSEFGQMKERLQADADLLQIVLESRIVHDGNGILRDHMRNADKSVDTTGSRLRIVKRVESRKIDAVVALSMACYQSLHSLNIGYAKGDDK